MSRGPTRFTQRDLTVAIKAARSAGLVVIRVEVSRDGKIVVVTAEQAAAEVETASEHEWDNAT